ncbi:hypothetical protein J3R83DRAFT_7102 [Lanmaoa asiatica]|nr:hypothetical protein J3R83DRAFT_7102 [Lanmaoa asiatica]
MHGIMFIPIILGSDKTTVSVDMDNSEYYPLYLSIGNVWNSMWPGHCTYICWDAVRSNEQLLLTSITINGNNMQAILINIYQIQKAQQVDINQMFQCTLGAAVISQITLFLPIPHVDIQLQSPNNLLISQVYTAAQKSLLVDFTTWDPQFR